MAPTTNNTVKKIEDYEWMKTLQDKSVFGLASQTLFDELGSVTTNLYVSKFPDFCIYKGNI